MTLLSQPKNPDESEGEPAPKRKRGRPPKPRPDPAEGEDGDGEPAVKKKEKPSLAFLSAGFLEPGIWPVSHKMPARGDAFLRPIQAVILFRLSKV